MNDTDLKGAESSGRLKSSEAVFVSWRSWRKFFSPRLLRGLPQYLVILQVNKLPGLSL